MSCRSTAWCSWSTRRLTSLSCARPLRQAGRHWRDSPNRESTEPRVFLFEFAGEGSVPGLMRAVTQAARATRGRPKPPGHSASDPLPATACAAARCSRSLCLTAHQPNWAPISGVTTSARVLRASIVTPKEDLMQRFLICGAVGLALLLGAFATTTPASAHRGWGWHHHHHHHDCWWHHGRRHCRWW